MTDVEDPGAAAHGTMLGENRVVLDGHIPSTETDEARP
jgi:hypothetical protein